MNVKGVSWIEDMRQKFDALCAEVDETVYEDTVNYVENQMRTVKESVKNFYSEVMQDLHDSSSRSSIKRKYTRKRNVAISGNTNIDDSYESVDAEQLVDESDGLCHSGEEQATSEDSRSQFTDLILNGSTIDETYIKGRQGQELMCAQSLNERYESLCKRKDISSDEASVGKSSDFDENEGEISAGIIEEYARGTVPSESQKQKTSNSGVSTDLDDTVSSTRSAVDTTVIDNLENAVEVHNKFYASDPGDRQILDVGTASAEKQGCLNPEESCVLVEKDSHFPTSTLEGQQKSYKKKIKAFSLKRWSTIKKIQEQLAAMYEEQSAKSLSGSSTRHTDIQNSQTAESLESEWELL